jgi:hypothetical protein
VGVSLTVRSTPLAASRRTLFSESDSRSATCFTSTSRSTLGVAGACWVTFQVCRLVASFSHLVISDDLQSALNRKAPTSGAFLVGGDGIEPPTSCL